MTALRCLLVLALTGSLAAMMAGCSVEARPSDVPAGAERVMAGSDELNYSASSRGTVYVFDETTDKMIYQTRVVRGDRIRISTEDGDVTLNGRNAVENVAVRGRAYEVWFDAEGSRD